MVSVHPSPADPSKPSDAARPAQKRGVTCENCHDGGGGLSSSAALELEVVVDPEKSGVGGGSSDSSASKDTSSASGDGDAGPTCKDRCRSGYHPQASCQCNLKCINFKNCCEDFLATCIYSTSATEANGAGKKNDRGMLIQFWALAGVCCLLTLAAAVLLHSWMLSRMASDALRDVVSAASLEKEENDFGHKIVLNWLYIRFMNWRVEEQYQQWSIQEKVRNSAVTLAIGVCVMLFGLTARFFEFGKVDCIDEKNGAIFVAIAFLVAMFVLSVRCAVRPTEELYWLSLLCAFAFVPATQLPPLSPSCHVLHTECKESQTKSSFLVLQSRRHVDCTLQGQTSMQVIVAWLLLTPWMMPRQEMIHLVWLWLLGVYVGWTYLYKHISDSKVFSDADVLWRVTVLILTQIIATSKKYYIEKSIRLKFAQELAERAESKKMFGILEVMMPSHIVVPMMKNPGSTLTEEINCVSILFVLICDFDQVARAHSANPKKLLRFLNEQFTQYDDICEENKVAKIETVGEEFVAAVGTLPQEVQDQKDGVYGHDFLLDRLMEASAQILYTQNDKVKVKLGVHSGPIVAGVVGKKLPRYRLFGDTINSAARMMQKGVPGAVQFGVETYDLLSAETKSKVKYRDEVEMKGKGKLKAWTFTPDPSTTPIRENVKKLRTASTEDDMAVSKTTTSSKKPNRMSLAKRAFALARNTKFLGEPEDLEPDKEKAFSDALEQMKEADGGLYQVSTWLSMERFDKANEEVWQQTFHDETFTKKITGRFGLTCLLLATMTGFEYYWLCDMKISINLFPHAFYKGDYRMQVFVGTRLLALSINILWWYLWDGRRIIPIRSRSVQTLLLLSDIFCLWMIYISYDAVSYSDNSLYQQIDSKDENWLHAPDDQSLILNFVLFFNLTLSTHKYRFVPALLYIPAMIFMTWSAKAYIKFDEQGWFKGLKHFPHAKEWQDFFSYQGEFLLAFQLAMHIRVAFDDERSSRALFKAQEGLKKTSEATQKILTTLMPEDVVEEVKLSQISDVCHTYRHLVIAQSDLCGFTQLSSHKKPTEVVQFMGELFGLFDGLSDIYGVYKVETIGDAYIAGMADKPLTKEYSPINVLIFGLEMVRKTDEWARHLGVEVTCRVGVHYGECTGGVVGNQMQRYHLFGDTLTVMDTLEATSEQGRVQVSGACKTEVERQLLESPDADPEGVHFIERDVDKLRTSKGEEHDWDEVGGITYLVASKTKPLRCTGAPEYHQPPLTSSGPPAAAPARASILSRRPEPASAQTTPAPASTPAPAPASSPAPSPALAAAAAAAATATTTTATTTTTTTTTPESASATAAPAAAD
eukprot:CAMPEP_0206567284 /NCGR_PEP_ID=MMETSP0325_2-20121206/25145_1 /ASSEMBLY_ACC=CAM_ASM_000347 /TAXON_ID=2866 /ORGANISM="Crypthecodinium cohnii, Strain Seligo" /LENGTH=1325 /DNA_ID=CAMNT_0054070441 /DNA_START=94 /DNA_END=4072 /DNA_ORIENTATION=-